MRWRRFAANLSYANVMATFAVFIALGGGAYAAATLPDGSVGAAQIKPNAVSSSKVKNGSLLRQDFRSGQLPRGARGRNGPVGKTGPQGKQGVPGPAPITTDGQADTSDTFHGGKIGAGLELIVDCAGGNANLFVQPAALADSFYGWGTSWDGSVLTRVQNDGNFHVFGTGTADIDGVARVSGPGHSTEYAHVDVEVISASHCNYHAVVIPAS